MNSPRTTEKKHFSTVAARVSVTVAAFHSEVGRVLRALVQRHTTGGSSPSEPTGSLRGEFLKRGGEVKMLKPYKSKAEVE